MKITLQQQVDQIELAVKNKHDHILECYFATNPKHELIYDIESHKTGKIVEKRVTKYYLHSVKMPYLYGNLKPTKKFVATLIEWFNNYNPGFDDIMVGYEFNLFGSTKASGAFYLKLIGTFGKNGKQTFNREELVPISEALIEKYGTKEGYAPCSYCDVQVPVESLIEHTVYALRNTHTKKYCSKQCGGYAQMASEG